MHTWKPEVAKEEPECSVDTVALELLAVNVGVHDSALRPRHTKSKSKSESVHESNCISASQEKKHGHNIRTCIATGEQLVTGAFWPPQKPMNIHPRYRFGGLSIGEEYSNAIVLTAKSSWWPRYSPSWPLSRSARCSLRNAATAWGVPSTVPDPIRDATPFTGFLHHTTSPIKLS